MRLDGKVTIITGGGSGMGKTASELLAREGAKVVVSDVSEASGEAVAAAVRSAGGDATFVRADVSNEDDARAMVQHAVATYRRVDALYNNAGVMPEADHSVIDTDVATWDKVMA
ncbi:MAG TPA: SDR family NAD(P)-dependent oxidoreductase, partial [Candidatus Limnocylindrales bacterium]